MDAALSRARSAGTDLISVYPAPDRADVERASGSRGRCYAQTALEVYDEQARAAPTQADRVVQARCSRWTTRRSVRALAALDGLFGAPAHVGPSWRTTSRPSSALATDEADPDPPDAPARVAARVADEPDRDRRSTSTATVLERELGRTPTRSPRSRGSGKMPERFELLIADLLEPLYRQSGRLPEAHRRARGAGSKERRSPGARWSCSTPGRARSTRTPAADLGSPRSLTYARALKPRIRANEYDAGRRSIASPARPGKLRGPGAKVYEDLAPRSERRDGSSRSSALHDERPRLRERSRRHGQRDPRTTGPSSSIDAHEPARGGVARAALPRGGALRRAVATILQQKADILDEVNDEEGRRSSQAASHRGGHPRPARRRHRRL